MNLVFNYIYKKTIIEVVDICKKVDKTMLTNWQRTCKYFYSLNSYKGLKKSVSLSVAEAAFPASI